MTKTAKQYLIDWLAAHQPDEWHRVACSWNWDAGYDVLNWIVGQGACDKATALHLFWLGGPDWYLAYRSRDDILERARWAVDGYDFLDNLIVRWRAGQYKAARFATEGVDEAAAAYAHTEKKYADNLPWIVPTDMRRDIKGQALDWSGYAEGYPPALVKKFNAEGISF